MAIRKEETVVRQLRTLFGVGTLGDLTDGQLLERFSAGAGRGEAAELAFAELVERHGPMVLRVCRDVLDDPHDTQDAFQATFLVLVKKARGLWVQDSLGPWLHQVAFRTASCARSAVARRRRHERLAAIPVSAAAGENHALQDAELKAVFHEEIERLATRFRVPLVLCDLEGRTHEQAARHLGWPVGTVKSRLSRGRERLRDRLIRRGFAPRGTLPARGEHAHGLEAVIPPALIDSTTRAALGFTTVRTLVRGSSAVLAQGVLLSMTLTRCAKIATVFLFLGATTLAVDLLVVSQTSGVAAAQAGGDPQAAAGDNLPIVAVQPAKLGVAVIERGVLEASESTDVYCTVQGGTTLLSILPVGTRVAKGDIVCELDASALLDQFKKQKIATLAAAAAFENARLTREVAEIAVTEYSQGVFKSQLEELSRAIEEAQAGVVKEARRVDRTRQARERLRTILSRNGGAANPADIVTELDIDDRLDAAEAALQQQRSGLDHAKARRDTLEKYTRTKAIKQFESEVEKARLGELAQKQTWEIERDKEAKLERQVQNCKILAPRDGVVVYADNAQRSAGGPLSIVEGAPVRERQKLFSVIDFGGPMLLTAKIGESMIAQIKNNLPVRIRVDAFPDEIFPGTVQEIAPLSVPSNGASSFRDANVYMTRVRIDRRLPQLRPGMTAQAAIMVDELQDVLSVPLTAVEYGGGKARVRVQEPGGALVWRDVRLGASDGERVQIKQGILSGERVLLNAHAESGSEQPRPKL